MELMIVTFLTLIVLATTLGALNDALRANTTVSLVSEMQHNGRTGLTLMARDLMQAGQGIRMGGIPIPSGAGVLPIMRPGPNSLTFPVGSVVIPAVTPGQALGPTISGLATDILTILYADSMLPLDQSPVTLTSDGSAMTVEPGTPISGVGTAIAPGDLIMFSAGGQNAIQSVTAVNNQTVYFASGDSMNLNQRTAPAGTVMQLANQDGTFPSTTATRIWMITYYIDADDPDSPRLMRVLSDGTPRSVALDIADLQFTYDLVDGTTNPANVDEPVSPNSPAQIRKVNVRLSAQSRARESSTGEIRRQRLTTHVALRSLTFVDRYFSGGSGS